VLKSLRKSDSFCFIGPKPRLYCLFSLDYSVKICYNKIQEHEKYFKQTLKKIYEKYFESATPTIASLIRMAICRLDEVLYLEI